MLKIFISETGKMMFPLSGMGRQQRNRYKRPKERYNDFSCIQGLSILELLEIYIPYKKQGFIKWQVTY